MGRSAILTWKMKYRVIRLNSSPEYLGTPSKRASRRSTTGSSAIRIASATGGRIPGGLAV